MSMIIEPYLLKLWEILFTNYKKDIRAGVSIEKDGMISATDGSIVVQAISSYTGKSLYFEPFIITKALEVERCSIEENGDGYELHTYYAPPYWKVDSLKEKEVILPPIQDIVAEGLNRECTGLLEAQWGKVKVLEKILKKKGKRLKLKQRGGLLCYEDVYLNVYFPNTADLLRN